MFGALLGMAGGIVGGMMQANAIEEATEAQLKAIEKQRTFVYNQLAPGKINRKARAADEQRAQDRLRLQGIVDPQLLKARYDAEKQISDRLNGLTGDSADKVADVAAKEAIEGTRGLDDIKAKLIDSAMQELNAGATLPSDVQAELVQAGLERTGQMSGAATTEGFGNEILRKVIGTAAMQLKAERQERAKGLAAAAQDMDVKRQAILGSLFPNLVQKSVSKLGAASGVLGQSNSMVPEAGLGGSDIANLWLARVGSTNQLAQSAADIASRGTMGQAQAWGNAIGGIASGAGSLLNQLLNKPEKTTT